MDILNVHINKYMKKALTIVSIIGSTVASAFAQIAIGATANGSTANAGALNGLLRLVNDTLARLVPIAIGLGVVGFLFFLVKFIFQGASDVEKKKEAISGMTYSILALFLMVAVWGIVFMLANLLGVGLGGTPPTPVIPGQPNI